MGPDGRSKGFAFVTMMDEDMDEKCMKLDGHELKGTSFYKNPNLRETKFVLIKT